MLVARPELIVNNGPQPIDLSIDAGISSPSSLGLQKSGPGVARFTKDNNYGGETTVDAGTLLIDGIQLSTGVTVLAGTLGGTGTVAGIFTLPGATVAPGASAGVLRSANGNSLAVSLAEGSTFAAEILSATSFDQLGVTGTVTLSNATLGLTLANGITLPVNTNFKIIDNDGADAVDGTFANLPEGATLIVDRYTFTVSYRGGDGNDVVLTVTNVAPDVLSYYLAEGATGGFFDEDVVIANPNDTDAPVTLTFLQEGGGTIVEHRTVPKQARLTVHVDQIAGLENASPSVQIVSDQKLPLIAERSMFWDALVLRRAHRERRREAGAEVDLRRRLPGVLRHVPAHRQCQLRRDDGDGDVLARERHAGREDDPDRGVRAQDDLRRRVQRADRARVRHGRRRHTARDRGTLDVLREPPESPVDGRTREHGRHGAIDVLVPRGRRDRRLLQHVHPAQQSADDGRAYRPALPARRRHDDREDEDAAGRTAADGESRPTRASRGWRTRRCRRSSRRTCRSSPSDRCTGRAMPRRSAKATTAPASSPPRRAGAWPKAASARRATSRPTSCSRIRRRPPREVTVTYLREAGAPVTKTYTVPPTSRFNIDVAGVVPELHDESFGARIEVTNGVAIAVERSLYWDANGIFWAGGTNALATPLP